MTSLLNRVYPRFESVAVGGMTMSPGGRGGFSSFVSRDGVHLIFEHFEFPSHVAAKEAYHSMLNASERIIEREVLHDRTGKLVTGERVVATFRNDDGVKSAAVISLDDTKVYWFASTSMRHVLFFERAHRRY